MALMTKTNKTSQSATSSRMKRIFIILCISLCIFSFILYSNTTLNWTALSQIIAKSGITLSFPSNHLTDSSPKDGTTSSHKINSFILPPSQNRRFAIFACSIHASTLAYTFYTPITAASWKRIGYEAIVVFVGDFLKPNVLTPRLNLSRNYLKHVGAHIVDVQCNESYSIKLSQLVRVFSGFLPSNLVQDEDIILTSDSDLMPLKQSEYQPTPGTDGFIFNAFCCGPFYRRGRNYTMFPMGHIFLQKKVWRAIVIESKPRAELLVNASESAKQLLREDAPLSFDQISLYGRHEFQSIYDQDMIKGDAAWGMDQTLCSMLLHDYMEKHSNFNLSQRDRIERLDRASPMTFWDRDKFDQFGDAHLKHDEILVKGNWNIFTKLLKALFNETMVTLFDDYYTQYMIIDKVQSKARRR